MYFKRYFSIIVNLTILCQCLVSGSAQTTPKPSPAKSGHAGSQDDIARDVGSQGLLGQHEHSTTETDKVTIKPKPLGQFDVKMAPKYMLDLYEKYKNGKIHRGKQIANTVRSIQAEIGVVNTQSMFVFNLSSVFWSEKILRAEIHVYKRRTKTGKRSDIFMDMHELGPTFIRKLDHRRIPEASYGWQAADVTTAVQACRHHSDGLPRMMAIAFTAPEENDKLEPISVKSLVRRISRPYLIVYSNDTQNITTDHIQPHLSPRDLTSSYVEPSTGTLERFSAFGRDKRESAESGNDESPKTKSLQQKWFGDNKFFEYFTSSVRSPSSDLPISRRKNSKDKAHNEVYDVRSRRSILDNEIPEDPDEELKPDETYNVPMTHPGILQGRGSNKKRQEKHSKKSDGKEQLIPYPENYKRKHRKHRKNRRKNQRQKNRKAEFDNLKHDGWGIDDVMSDNDRKKMCSKRTMSVDFADIGWSEWIISPRSFDANYCAGSCPFPLAQRLKPTNHATIQSLIHAIGLNAKVPSPCCVADKMSSVTLLFFDDNRNVVLKNYPDMSVESCMCR